jgi:hypothetical protein
MGYVREHEHALLNANNVVFNVVIFESQPDATLLEIVKTDNNASAIISCNAYGLAVIGGSWDGQHFLDANGNRVPPTRMPDDGMNAYGYDWETNQWVVLSPGPQVLLERFENNIVEQ